MEKLKIFWFSNQLKFGVQLLGVSFFVFYGVLTLIFYRERMLSFDSAAFSFEIVQTKSFFLPLKRWGSLFSQIIPLLFVKSGSSLTTFLIVYSFNFTLLYYIGFLIITVVFKNYRVGLIYLLTLCLTYRNTFYFSVSELSQGLALVVVLYAILCYFIKEKAKFKNLVLVLAALLIGSLYYFHQLLIIPIVFIFGLTIISNKEYKNYYLWLLLLFGVLWFGIHLLLLSTNSYEISKIPSLAIFLTQLPNLNKLPSFIYFVYFFEKELIVATLLFVGSLILFLYKKQGLLFTFFLIYPLVYLLIIIITYYRGEGNNMYEQYYILFGFFIALAVVVSTKKMISTNYLIIILIPVFIVSFYQIYASHELPTKRLQYLTNLVKNGQKLSNKKYVIHPEDYPAKYAWGSWALPVETILLSSIESKHNSVTFYLPQPDEQVELNLTNGQLHAAPWHKWLMNTSVLDANYFNIPKNTSYIYLNKRPRNKFYFYELIKYDFIWMKSIKEKAKNKNISIEEAIRIDADYMYSISHIKTPLEEKILEIKENKEWMKLMQEKATEQNINIEEVIRTDAKYILKNEE